MRPDDGVPIVTAGINSSTQIKREFICEFLGETFFFKSSLFAEPSDERLALVYINPDVIVMTTEDQGSVVRRPISANPGLNLKPGFLISLFKCLFQNISLFF